MSFDLVSNGVEVVVTRKRIGRKIGVQLIDWLIVSRCLPTLVHIVVESLAWIIRRLAIMYVNSISSNRSRALAWFVTSLPDSFNLKLYLWNPYLLFSTTAAPFVDKLLLLLS